MNTNLATPNASAPVAAGKNIAAAQSTSTTVLIVDEGQNEAAIAPLMLNAGNFVPTVNIPTSIHLGGTNYLYLDGHVKFLQVSKFNPAGTEWNF